MLKRVSLYGSFLLAAITISLIFGCSDGTINGPQTREPYQAEKPSLELISQCDSSGSGGVIKAISKTAKEFAVVSANGDTLSQGVFESDTVSVSVADGNGSYQVLASNEGGTAKSSASFDCEDEPLQPGLSFSKVCSSGNQGELTVNADNGVSSFELIFIETGEVVAEASDIAIEENWTKTFTDLEDGDYRFNAERNGEDGSVEPSFNCDGSGTITVEKTCDMEQGDVTITIQNGVRSWTLFQNGEEIDSQSGLTPTKNQEVVLGGLDDGDYTFEGIRNSIIKNKEFSISCDVPGPGNISVDSECIDENGKLTISSSQGFEVARLLDDDGNVIEEKTGFDPESDPEAVFEGLADQDLTAEVERNSKTDSSEETVDCDIPGPETPELISNSCSVDPYDGVLVFSVDSEADTYELRDADTDDVVRDGSINGRSELELSSLADGDYYLVVIRNYKEASSNTTTVECDLITRVCEFLFDGDKLVDGLDKFFIEPLSNERKTVFTFEPVKTPRMLVDIRLSQGEQVKEAYAIGFVAGSDTVFTQIRQDQDNSGSGERWLTDQFKMEQSTIDALEVGKAYKIIAVHGGYLDPDLALGGGQSVFFSSEEPTGENNKTGGRIVIESDKTP